MTETTVLMGSFQDLDRAVNTLDELRKLGISNDDITVLSSLPYSHKALGRPQIKTWLPLISLGSAAAGLLVGAFFTIVTPHLYVISVGGQALVPTPTTAVLLFEFTMLFLVLGTFLGMVLLNRLPTSGPQYDGASLTDDRIGLLLRCPNSKLEAARAVLSTRGADGIHQPQRRES